MARLTVLVLLLSATACAIDVSGGAPRSLSRDRALNELLHKPAAAQRSALARRRAPSPQLQAAGMHAAGMVGSLALASEVVQIVNTFAALLLMNRMTGASSFVGLVEVFAGFFNKMGWVAYPVYSAMLLTITILPLMSAILFIVLAGMVFGTVRGTVLVSMSLSSAAAISAAISRRVAAAKKYGLANIDPSAAAVDAAIAKGPTRNALLLVTLLRLSPVLPFTFSNYLAGLTSLPIWVVFLGTALGTLPTQAVYVGAGALGKQALEGGVKLPKSILALGALATVAAIALIGHISQKVLSGMELDKQAETTRKRP